MADEGFKRKLAAILSADVIGYSRLMRDDEEVTVRDIASQRVRISETTQKHHGRVIDSPGYNILAEFVEYLATTCQRRSQNSLPFSRGQFRLIL